MKTGGSGSNVGYGHSGGGKVKSPIAKNSAQTLTNHNLNHSSYGQLCGTGIGKKGGK